MTDRDLLEMAAKAAGILHKSYMATDAGIYHDGGQWWNPLKDDGDALRLSVQLKIPLQFPDWADVSRTWGPKHGHPCDEEFTNDHYAATRRAIVRAAAEIGKDMTQGDKQ